MTYLIKLVGIKSLCLIQNYVQQDYAPKLCPALPLSCQKYIPFNFAIPPPTGVDCVWT